MQNQKIVLAALLLILCVPLSAASAEYVGSAKCGECHEEEHGRFMKYSPKAHSWESIKVMAPKLTTEEQQECYECHTTGYKKGGFVSYEETPELADVGCETCHGPGAAHAEDGDPELISRKPDPEDCVVCHSAARVNDFGFKPLVNSGAH
ncbi:MAG: cytochrome c family protein [Desulfovibrionales bacterium]|nr:cytochrome c family protein [Desulfovibrionales bacterium]